MNPPDTRSIIESRLRSGESLRQIAAGLGISLRRVYQIRGVQESRQKIDGATIEAVKRDVSGGMSQRAAAELHGMSRKTVAGICATLDLPPVSKKSLIPAEKIALVLTRHRAGVETHRIAFESSLPPSTVRSIIRRHPREQIAPGDIIMQAIAGRMALGGTTVGDLARIMGEPPTREHLYKILRGDVQPTSVIASRILDALGGRIEFAD